MRTIFNKKVKIKKLHKCWGCTTELSKGTIVTRNVCVTDDGDLTQSYWCDCCNAFLNTIDYDEGFYFGEFLGEDVYNRFKENYYDHSNNF